MNLSPLCSSLLPPHLQTAVKRDTAAARIRRVSTGEYESQRKQKRTAARTGEGKETPTSSSSLLSQEAKSKCESDRFTRAPWEEGSRPRQEAEVLLREWRPLGRSRGAWGKGRIWYNVCEEWREKQKDTVKWVRTEVHKFVGFSSTGF